jgi:quercetin dioxygenase-like cupin family protein
MKARHAAVLGGAGLLCAAAFVNAQHFSVTPDQLKWSKSAASPSDSAVVMGKPGEGGHWVVRARLKPGMKVMPHSHPVDVHVTVLSGTLLYSEGDTFDEKTLKEYPAGSFFMERANTPHFQMPKGNTEVIFQAHGTGVNAFKYVNPADDPRNK